jgi:hypothetical protein
MANTGIPGSTKAPTRTVWHVLFAALVLERRSPDFEVLAEVPLTSEPPRADLLLVRKRRLHVPPAGGKVLRGLWPRLGSDTLVEFKSAARPLRRGDLIRLLGYGAHYHAHHVARLAPREPGLVLVVPRLSRALDAELSRLDWRLGENKGGYVPLEGGPYRGWVVSLEQVGLAERDEVLVPFVQAKVAMVEGSEGWRWWQNRLVGPSGDTNMPDVSKLEGYDELVSQMLARVPPSRLGQVLAKLPAKKRLAMLSTQALLAGLGPEEREALAAQLRQKPTVEAKPKRRRSKAPR